MKKVNKIASICQQVAKFEQGSQRRTFVFHSSDELKLFLQLYSMSIEKCLLTMAMDELC